MSTTERIGRALAAAGLATHALFAPISIAATQIGLGVAFSGLILCALAGRRPARTPLDLSLALFVAAALASTIFSREGTGSAINFTLWRHAAGFWICWQTFTLASDARVSAARVLALAGVGLAAASLVGILQYRTGIDVVHALHLRRDERLVGAPGVPERFAAMGFFISRLTFGHNAMILVALLVGAAIFADLSTRLRAWQLTASALGLCAIVLTFDRAAWLGLFAAALALGVCWFVRRSSSAHPDKDRGGGRTALLIAAAFSLLCVVAGLVPSVRARFASAFDVQQNSDRIFLWTRALEIIRDHPLLGIGFGNYPRVCSRYYDLVDPSFPMRTWAHNSLLSLTAETGFVGLCAVALLAFAIVRALLVRLREGGRFTAGAIASACALLVVAQMHDVVYDSKVMYPLWLALVVGLHPRLGAQTRN